MQVVTIQPSNGVIWLTAVVAALALVAAGAGLLWKGQGPAYSFTTLRGQDVQIYGRGLYRYDTLFFGAGYKGQDAVVLLLGVPLLLVSLFFYRRGSLGGALLLSGTLGYFLYVYASMALGAAYNRLFLVYVALFSASLFALILTMTSLDLQVLGGRLDMGLGAPRRALAGFLFAGGLVTLFVWGAPLLAALIRGVAPERMDSYTTMVTYGLDLGIITPACFVGAMLIWRGAPLGYLVAMPLLVIIILLAPQILISTIVQRAAGVDFTIGEMVGPVAGFVLLGGVALWLLVSLLRSIGLPA